MQTKTFLDLTLFYLKLQTKLLLPSSTIQNILEDYQEIHVISQSHLLFKLKEKLVSLSVTDTLQSEDLFRACDTQTLQTDHKRKSVFKSNFSYVEPVSICLGQNESGKECFVQYIPVRNTTEPLLQCRSVWKQHRRVKIAVRSEDVHEDVWDGKKETCSRKQHGQWVSFFIRILLR